MFDIDANGTITLVQGDSGQFNVTGIPTDKNYMLSFGVQDENRNPIGDEIEVATNKADRIIIKLTGGYTDNWVVPFGEDNATYYYGLKLWTTDGSYEDTSIIADSVYKGKIVVLPKIVEGYR